MNMLFHNKIISHKAVESHNIFGLTFLKYHQFFSLSGLNTTTANGGNVMLIE